jgi:hypothetical protein
MIIIASVAAEMISVIKALDNRLVINRAISGETHQNQSSSHRFRFLDNNNSSNSNAQIQQALLIAVLSST